MTDTERLKAIRERLEKYYDAKRHYRVAEASMIAERFCPDDIAYLLAEVERHAALPTPEGEKK